MPKDPKIIGHLRYYDRADGIHYVLLFHWERGRRTWCAALRSVRWSLPGMMRTACGVFGSWI